MDSQAAAPKVSCIIPAYNCAAFVKTAVQSVLSPNGPSCEVIVVDDGSTDDTAAVLQSFAGQIQIIHQENQGVSAARNRGLQAARGEFTLFLDADDWRLPGMLQKQAAVLEADARLGVVHSGWRVVDVGGTAVSDKTPWQQAPRLDLATWLLWKPVFLGAMLFRREWLVQVGGFDTSLKQAEDVDLLLKLSLAGCRMAWLRESTVCYRQHGSSTMQNGHQQAVDMTAVLDRFFARPDLPRRVRRLEAQVRYYTLLWLVWQLDQTGYAQEMLPYLRQSRQFHNFPPQMQAHHWLGQLLRHAEDAGASTKNMARFWPAFQQGLEMSDAAWAPLAEQLSWWLTVWWPYMQGRPAAVSWALADGLSVDALVQRVQNCLVSSPQPVPVGVIDQFWQDAQARGVVPPDERFAVTSLYLTLWSQSLLGRWWQTAVFAFGKLLQVGLYPQSLPAWGRFLKTAVAYGRAQLRGTR